MATATTATQESQVTTELSLLEQVLSMPVGKKVREVDAALQDRIEKIESLLPDFMRGQATRLARRASLTFASNLRLQECTPQSFIKCVLQAAELGFAIDGKFAYAVPYDNVLKDANGKSVKDPVTKKDKWVKEAQCQFDYKALIATAKRLGLIQDAWARRVFQNDSFFMEEENGVTNYRHSFDHRVPRGEVVGGFAVVTHKEGWYRVEYMHISDIHGIRARSKSFTASNNASSPWVRDAGEMEKKTVLRRLLKTFTDDPGLVRMYEIDDEDIGETGEHGQRIAGPSKLDQLTDRLVSPAKSVESIAEDADQLNTETEQPTFDFDSLFATYQAELLATSDVISAQVILERNVGPESNIPWPDEYHARIEELYSNHTESIRKSRGQTTKSQKALV